MKTDIVLSINDVKHMAYIESVLVSEMKGVHPHKGDQIKINLPSLRSWIRNKSVVEILSRIPILSLIALCTSWHDIYYLAGS